MRSLPHLPRGAVIAVALVGSVGLAAAGTSVATAATRSSSAQRIGVANAQPALSGTAATAEADARQQIAIKLYLPQRNSAALKALVAKVSTPGSASYAKYLTPAQFRARFAPAPATVSAVTKFLTGSGLKLGEIPANKSYITATGSVAKVEKAFDTSLKVYKLQGQRVRAAAVAPTLPASLQGKVLAVSGLASISALSTPDHEDGAKVAGSTSAAAPAPGQKTTAPPPDAFVNAGPCSSYYGEKVATTLPKAYGKYQPYAPCGYTPPQIQSAYGLSSAIKSGVTGKGVTVAIVDAYAAPTILSDANTYAAAHGGSAFAGGQFNQSLPSSYRYGYDDTVNGDICGEQGWYGEETLDVEAVHGVAPGANVTYVAASSCDNGDFAEAINRVVDNHLASIVTNSWGGTDESNGSPELDAVYEAVFAQAAVEGIGYYFSSGDSGDGSSASTDGKPTPEAPSNSPLVTAVGGTSLAVGKDGKREWETGWSTGKSTLTKGEWTPKPPGAYLYGAGGGTSKVFTQPDYQAGVVPSSLSRAYSKTKARVTPDVSAFADPGTGMLVGETQTFPDKSVKYSEYRIGGTSLASPTFAGMMALADQYCGYAHGFANPALYKLYKTGALYDPKPKSNLGVVRVDYTNGTDATDGTAATLRSIDVAEKGTILRTKSGYDDITGIGSPAGPAFLTKLAALK